MNDRISPTVLFDNIKAESNDECLESESEIEAGRETVSLCRICDDRCKLPKVLSCLHVFCAECLSKQLNNSSPCSNDSGLSEHSNLLSDKLVLICSVCSQQTRLWINGTVDELPTDYVLNDMIEALDIRERQIICTSCKSRQSAIARCDDCDSFLCSGCVDAHQYMRCFENHKVISFNDVKEHSDVLIHKPIHCSVHTSEIMKFYCNTCQVPICNECMVSKHMQPMHSYDRISSVEASQVSEIKEMITTCKQKQAVYTNTMTGLTNDLAELQLQKDSVKGMIEETYQTYKAILEKIKNKMLDSLEEMHSELEINVMDQLHMIEKTKDRIEDGCSFTERVLTNGNALEILLIKKWIIAQLARLCQMPTINAVEKIEFITDEKRYEELTRNSFGRLTKSGISEPLLPTESDKKVTVSSATINHSPLSFEIATTFDKEITSSPESLEGFALANALKANHLPSHSLFDMADSLNLLPVVTTTTYPQQNFSMSFGGLPARVSAVSDLLLERGSNSHSPAMSDSGISADTASCGSGIVNQNNPSNFGGFFGNMMPPTGLLKQVSQNEPITSDVSSDFFGNNVQNCTTSGLMSPIVSTPEISLASLLNSLGPSSGMGSLFNNTQHSITPVPFGGLSHSGSTGITSNTISQMGGPASHNFVGANNVQLPHPMRNPSKNISPMQIRCKFGQQGVGRGQFNSPHGFCLGPDDDIVVADTMNHRIMVFDKGGEYKYHFGIPGKEEGQLWYPRKVAIFRQTGRYIVCDRGSERSRMQIFMKTGLFVKKIAIRYIDIVAGLAITPQGHIVAVDSVTPTVFCVSEAGDLVRWFDCSEHMREPSDIAVCGREYFVCDFKGHCVVVFSETGEFLRRIGSESITTFPNGIDISDAGDVLIGDSHGNRFHIAVFQRDGTLVGDFECPYIKVSRCCGLKITSEGYLVTLAKNNHFVLVLNTLYIA